MGQRVFETPAGRTPVCRSATFESFRWTFPPVHQRARLNITSVNIYSIQQDPHA